MTNWTDFSFLLAVFAGWFVLVRWILPWLGISTCCSCSCSVEPPTGAEDKEEENAS